MADPNNKKKRERAENFSEYQQLLLIRLANAKKRIIEDKRTDVTSNTAKEVAWKEIGESFNSTGTGPHRTVKSLQEKYKQIKKELRKEDANQKKHITGTGGGKCKKPRVLTEEETELASTIALTISGLPNWYGSDASASNIDFVETATFSPECKVDDEEIFSDWGRFQAPMLQTSKHCTLQTSNSMVRNMPCLETTVAIVPAQDITSVTPPLSNNREKTLRDTVPNDEGSLQPSQNETEEVLQLRDVPVDNAEGNREVYTRRSLIPKKRPAACSCKNQPFVELARLKQEWVKGEIEIIEKKKQYLAEKHMWDKEQHIWEMEMLEEKHKVEIKRILGQVNEEVIELNFDS